MKILKTAAAILFAATISTGAMAQKLSAKQVPQAVKASFEKAYPGIKTVKWEKEKTDFEAGFKMGATEMSAVFKADGTQLETEQSIKATELPANVTAYVKQNYKGAAIKEAAKITKAGGEVNYEAEVNKTDLLFDSAGKFIKAAKD